MAYIKREWKLDTFHKGDKEFLDGLNHMEDGIAEGGGGGGEPAQYLKDAVKSADGNTLTITKKDGSQVVFAPSTGGGEPAAYIKDAAVSSEKLTLTKKDGSTVELDVSVKANVSALQEEANTRQTNDQALEQGILDEASARESVDNNLQTAINQESTTREQADTTLQNNINTKANIGDSYTKAESDAKYLTEHQDISGKQDKLTAGDGISITDVTISVDNTIARKQELPNFRGNWANWNAVPTDSSLYPADFTGNKIPTTNDYLVVENASDVINPSGEIDFTKQYNITRNANSAVFTLTEPNGDTSSITHVNDGVTVKYLGKNNEFIIKSIGNAEWTIKCSYKVSYNGTIYAAGSIIATTMYYDRLAARLYLPEGYKDTWQFKYVGNWATDGKNGWKIDYQPAWSLPAYPADTTAEYVLGLKYENGAWKKYWKETVNRSDVVDSGMVDYMVLKQ